MNAPRRCLEVMQARLGARLVWQVEVDAALEGALLPPGLLLTLVDNAVVHGVERQLNGGRSVVSGWLQDGTARFAVTDNGAGPPADLHDGVGLSNIRQRLALACGASAHLHLAAAPEGGCRAQIELPYGTEP